MTFFVIVDMVELNDQLKILVNIAAKKNMLNLFILLAMKLFYRRALVKRMEIYKL